MKKEHHWNGDSLSKVVNETQSMLSIKKLALGTVQFGIDYGINNNTGMLDDLNLQELLVSANLNGINTLDTAYNYGKSEERLGRLLQNIPEKFNIISKAPQNSDSKNINTYFNKSIARLHVNNLYGYMLHNFDDYNNDKNIVSVLNSFKEKELVKKIGFSLYYPEQLEQLLSDNIQFDILQIPYNIADRRFESYFTELKDRDIEVHTRSVFLQGLFFMEENVLPDKLKVFIPLIKKLNVISQKNNKNIEDILLNFVIQKKHIDKVVLGVDNTIQLNKNIKASVNKLSRKELTLIDLELSEIKIPSELIIPSNWK